MTKYTKRQRGWMRFAGRIVFLLLAVSLAQAGALDSPIASGSKFTYERLLKLVFPDLKVESDDPNTGSATQSVAIREFDGAGQAAQTETEIPVTGVATEQADTGRGGALISFVTPIEGADVRCVALFDLAGEPKLLDVVQVPGFPDDPGSFAQKLRLNDKTSALVFNAYHHNSDQGYRNSTIVFVHASRIDMIAQVALLSYNGGSLGGSFEEDVTIVAAPDPGREFAKVVIRATLRFLADPPESAHQPRQRTSTRVYTSTLRWDGAKGKFSEPLDGLAGLDQFNKDKY